MTKTIQQKCVDLIIKERQRQDEKWGEQNHNPFKWMTILGEEYGETCKAALELCVNQDQKQMKRLYRELKKEAIQTAAVALNMVECFDRNQWVWK